MRSKMVSAALLAAFFTVPAMGKQTHDQNPGEPQKAATAQEPSITIPLCVGTTINATLIGALDSKANKPGDEVSALVAESVTYQRSVLLPKGSRIMGHVVRTGGDTDQGSAIFVQFDKAVLPNGQRAGLNAGIQALAAPGSAATIASRKDYEEDWIAGNVPSVSTGRSGAVSSDSTVVLPSTYTTPRKPVSAELPAQPIEGGMDHQGRFTPDSKGAFGQPNMRVFTPVSEGSHGTVLVGAQKNVHLENGTHLLIVIQPPAGSVDAR
jgi:hypothetical protein